MVGQVQQLRLQQQLMLHHSRQWLLQLAHPVHLLGCAAQLQLQAARTSILLLSCPHKMCFAVCHQPLRQQLLLLLPACCPATLAVMCLFTLQG
jgi:hypothetical protein